MKKTVIKRKLEIMQDIANIVRVHNDIELWRDIVALAETQKYLQCEEFGKKMNMELAVIEARAPDEAMSVFRIRFKIVMLRGIDVFGDPSEFLKWINRKTVIFGGKTPRSQLNSAVGLENVLGELGRISNMQ
ncbi:MAG TPA: MbcA/ParS/Xre antitoxin family protein [Nitrospirota bacterium]|nr:MbcA/ParS/Xre antitoxin family protein [Nitrospirota bacterium]